MKKIFIALLFSAILLSLSVTAFAVQNESADAIVPNNNGVYDFGNILPMFNCKELGCNDVLTVLLPEREEGENVQVMSACWVLVVIQELHCYPNVNVAKGSWIEINLQNRTHDPWASYEGTQAIKNAMYNKYKYDGSLPRTYFKVYTCEEWRAMNSW